MKKHNRATVRLDSVSWGVLVLLEVQTRQSKGVILCELINKGRLSPLPTPKELLTLHSVSFRLSTDDKELLEHMAREHGVTTGEIARRLLRGVTHRKPVDDQDALS